MISSTLLSAPIGFLPVVMFLALLRFFDSYKLVSVRAIIVILGAGGLTAIASYFANSFLMSTFDIEYSILTRYVAPIVEECLKASVIVWLLYHHRIGFLVDAAIAGFAVGTGFALVENFYYLQQNIVTNPGVWIVRGFGTAIMHGGVTAIFAILTQSLTERHMRINPLYLAPGLGAAIFLHSGFNHFFLSPLLHTACVLAVLPALLYLVFERSTASLRNWLQLDFDADADMLAQINSGEFSQSKIGHFLTELKDRFEGPVVVDMLCYLRLFTELALRAKALLMMREQGFDMPVDQEVKSMIEELKYLEQSIGKAGTLLLTPFLHFTRKDLWQLYVLES
jgi:RsiW-degrading membrane proteinase PrsW (M82 family)